jgi:hypothetical protein
MIFIQEINKMQQRQIIITNPFNPEILDKVESVLMEKYVHTPKNNELWCLLIDLMFQVSPMNIKPKVMGCLITGTSHSGKTTAVRQFKKAYLENVSKAKDNDIFLYRIPSRARLKGLMSKMGRQLKIPDISPKTDKRLKTNVIVEKVAKKLWKNGVKLVIIDEFQKLFELPGENRIEILSGFNDLVNESHIPIILVGTDGVEKILDVEKYYSDESDLRGTFCSRFMEFKLDRWQDPNDPQFMAFLQMILKDCALPSNLRGTFFEKEKNREWFINMTGGLNGKIIHLIKWSVRYNIRRGFAEKITKQALKSGLKYIKVNGW